jgi:hypothetical protein
MCRTAHLLAALALVIAGALWGCAHGGAARPAAAPAAAEAPPTPALKPSGLKKVFKGPEGQTVSMVFLEPAGEGQVLIRFDGLNSKWDGKVFLHQLRQSTGKEDYVTKVDGSDYVTVTMRDSYGARFYEVYPPQSRDSLRIQYSEEASEKLDPAAVVTRYESQPRN